MVNFTTEAAVDIMSTTSMSSISTTTPTQGIDDALIDSIINGGSDLVHQGIGIGHETLDKIGDHINKVSNPEDWELGLHQVLLFFLVIGRWMLPRGGIRLESVRATTSLNIVTLVVNNYHSFCWSSLVPVPISSSSSQKQSKTKRIARVHCAYMLSFGLYGRGVSSSLHLC